jgi:hypothetical protein
MQSEIVEARSRISLDGEVHLAHVSSQFGTVLVGVTISVEVGTHNAILFKV